jgi:UDP-GlcNAc:undecaprenyl-phosphate GlcNAc-1-phosphate transferase
VVCACNATNLLDGLDGLCGGVTGIIALGFLALAVWLAMWNNFPGSDQVRVVLCLAVAGAVLGFLPYNIPPASIFMGDAGSMMLGFFVATMMALFCLEGHIRWLFASCVIFALPILDTSLAVIRRLRSGKGVFVGDRSHLYDQLVDRGMSVKQVVGLFYLLSILAAVIGVTLSIVMRARHAIVVYLVLLVMVWTIFYKLGLVTPTENDHASDAGDTEPNEQ